jgi:hypothetical protein
MTAGKTIAPVRWGILGAANIAVSKVIPATRRNDCRFRAPTDRTRN